MPLALFVNYSYAFHFELPQVVKILYSKPSKGLKFHRFSYILNTTVPAETPTASTGRARFAAPPPIFPVYAAWH